jgi:hypothetical protein
MRRRRRRTGALMTDRIQSEGRSSSRVLLIANETVATDTVRMLIRRMAASSATVLVVAPALTSRIAFWTTSDGDARRHAERRLESCLTALSDDSIDAYGRVGDANPLLAVEDALRMFPADMIIVATHPEGRSNWLAHNIVERVRERFVLPVHHVVVDVRLGREELAA